MSKSNKMAFLGFLSHLQEYEDTLLERLPLSAIPSIFFYSVLLRIRVIFGVS